MLKIRSYLTIVVNTIKKLRTNLLKREYCRSTIRY